MPRPMRFDPYSEVGHTGINFSGGEIKEEWHPNLRDHKTRLRYYREIVDNTGVGGAIWRYWSTLMLFPSSRADPRGAKASPGEAAKAAEYLESNLHDMTTPWRQSQAGMLSAGRDGWSSSEVVYKQRLGMDPAPTQGPDGKPVPRASSKHSDGLIGWRKIEERSQQSWDRWEIDKDGRWSGWWQQPPSGGQPRFIPLEKTIHMRFEAPRDNPEGRSFFHSATVHYDYLRRFQEFEGVGLQRDVGGTVIVKVPQRYLSSTAQPAEQTLVALLKKYASLMGGNHFRGSVFPHEKDPDTGKDSGFGLDTLSTSQNLAQHHQAIIRHENRMALSVLMQWLFMAIDRVGAYGAQENSSDISGLILRSMLGHWYDLMNRYLVLPLMRMTPWDPRFYPQLVHTEIDKPTLQRLAAPLTSLISIGALDNDTALRDWLRRIGDIPPAIEAPKAEPATGPGGAPLGQEDAVQDLALNGAQSDSMRETVMAAARGELPPDSAAAMISMANPTIPNASIEAMLAPIRAGFRAPVKAPASVPQRNAA